MRKIIMLTLSVIGLVSVATAALTTGSAGESCKADTECCCKKAGECGGTCGMECCK